MTPASKDNSNKSLIATIVSKPLFWIIFVAMAFSIPIVKTFYKSVTIKPLAVLGKIPDFTLKNQFNKNVNNKELLGKINVINFIFTSCPDVCPLVTRQMKKIQQRTAYVSKFVKFSSISVDPIRDTPEVLKNFADNYEVDHRNWNFLVGPLKETQKIVSEGFKIGMDHSALSKSKNDDDHEHHKLNDMSVVHGEHFIITDQVGRIRSYLKITNKQDIEKALKIITILVNTPPGMDGTHKL